MNGDVMGKAIAEAIVDSAATAEAKQEVIKFWQKIANEIVDHIKSNAEVPAGISVTTSGTAAAQSGATTAPGKVQ